jgi:hypothetical protein
MGQHGLLFIDLHGQNTNRTRNCTWRGTRYPVQRRIAGRPCRARLRFGLTAHTVFGVPARSEAPRGNLPSSSRRLARQQERCSRPLAESVIAPRRRLRSSSKSSGGWIHASGRPGRCLWQRVRACRVAPTPMPFTPPTGRYTTGRSSSASTAPTPNARSSVSWTAFSSRTATNPLGFRNGSLLHYRQRQLPRRSTSAVSCLSARIYEDIKAGCDRIVPWDTRRLRQPRSSNGLRFRDCTPRGRI